MSTEHASATRPRIRNTVSRLAKQTPRCTYRVVHKGHDLIDRSAIRTAINAVEYAMTKRSLAGHLVVNVLAEEYLDGDGDCVLATFNASTNQIDVAGRFPIDLRVTREEWLQELQLAIITRVIEYEIETRGDRTPGETEGESNLSEPTI